MRRDCLLVVGMALCLLLASANLGLAQKTPAQKRDEQRENEAVREAQRDLQEARDQLKDAEKALNEEQIALRKALTTQKAAAATVQKVQDRLEAEHGERTGLSAARQQLRDVQAELDRAAKPVLERVHAAQRPLLETLERVKLRLKPGDDELSPARREAVEEHARLTKQLRDAEQTALLADAATRLLMERVTTAQTRVQEALRKFDAAVERDPELRAAQKAVDSAQRDVTAAESAAAKAARAVADARGKVTQATQKLQQKQAADARDKNQPKKPKKGK
jgi:chromosome segregation ATPase